jgi:hypothetical protein
MDHIHEDFTGSEIHFGTVWPSDAGEMPALHIWNSLVRAHRYTSSASGIDVDHVDVQWPETDSSTSYYIEFFDEIYIIAASQWYEGTFTHEYGHHFMANHSINQETDYCNGYCDGEEPCTSGTDCEDPGHCLWCPENNHDAWNEGVPNWLADTVLRSYPRDYQFDDCTPFEPFDERGYEDIGLCCQDGQSHDPWITEGFVSALLRDVDDERDDAHDDSDDDSEGWGGNTTDCMDLGADEILTVVTVDVPTNAAEFLSMFRSRYPQYMPGLWKTAQNVNPAYLAGFPADTAAPGPITVLSSPTHPSGIGGALPCITVEFDQPPDDVTGSAGFSVEWTTSPGGAVPDTTTDWAGSCVSQVTSPPQDFGTYYVSIRAVDWQNHWGPHETFGPFVINGDCNSNGIMDLCDIACDASDHAQDAGMQCSVPSSFCAVPGCGTSQDCNLNLVPDDCDLASGTSKDCDENGVPDECDAAAGTLIQWADGNGSWHEPNNWYKLSECPEEPPPPPCDSPFPEDCPALPALADNVCIDAGGDDITVTYTSGDTDIDILACYESLSISGGSIATLRLYEPSWVDGELGLSGNNSVLEVSDRLDIAGMFTWTGSNVTSSAKLKGPGVTYAHGGVAISQVVHLDQHHLVLDGDSTSVCDGRVDFSGPAVFEIRPGSTYEHQGSGYILNGWWSDQFINGGTLIKSTDSGVSLVYMFTDNSGLIHVQTGTLKFYLGSSSTGAFLADAGTTLEFNGGGFEFLAGSSIQADSILFSNGASGSNNVRGTYNVATKTTQNSGQALTFTEEANIISYGPSFYITKGVVNFDALAGGPIHFDTFSMGAGYYAGTANFNSGDPVEVTNLTLAPGTITGPSTITINGLLTWGASSQFRGPGTVNANGDVVVEAGGGEKRLYERVFNNAATATFLGPLNLSSSGVFNNLASGLIDIQADSGASIFGGSGVGGAELNNAGTMIKSAGTGTSTISAPTTNTGTVEVQTGVLQFYTYYGSFYTQTAGQTVLSGGDLAMFGPAPLRINGGLLTGEGSVTGIVQINNGGTAAPGLSAGIINIVGTYTQSVGGALEVEINGLGQGTDYDLLTVSSTASLAGSLDVFFPASGFTPLPGDSYEILTAGSVSGEFDPVTATNLSPFLDMVVVYDTGSVTVNMEGLVFGDCDLDGQAALADHADLQTCLTGPAGGFSADCRCFDFDDDGHIGLKDFAIFQAAFGAP